MDRIVRYLASNGHVRIFGVQSLSTIREANRIHHFSPTACAAVGRVLSAAAIMVAQEKRSANITLNFKTDGPIGGICAVARPGVAVKAYALDPMADVPPRTPTKLDVAGLMGRGRLSVAKDLNAGEPWVGQVDLLSGEIAEDIAGYYFQSEQQPSLVALGVLVGTDYVPSASGGIVAQPLPGCTDEEITALENCARGLTDISARLLEMGDIEPVAEAAFGELGLEKLEEIPLAYACDCSKARVERALIALGKKELEELCGAMEQTEVSCHFCNRQYRFEHEELTALLREATGVI